jgi:hypothetical protein
MRFDSRSEAGCISVRSATIAATGDLKRILHHSSYAHGFYAGQSRCMRPCWWFHRSGATIRRRFCTSIVANHFHRISRARLVLVAKSAKSCLHRTTRSTAVKPYATIERATCVFKTQPYTHFCNISTIIVRCDDASLHAKALRPHKAQEVTRHERRGETGSRVLGLGLCVLDFNVDSRQRAVQLHKHLHSSTMRCGKPLEEN